MAETLYAFTNIIHGNTDGTTIEFTVGDVFDPKGFSKEDIASLISAGAISRVDPIAVEAPPLSVEDVAASTSVDSKKP